MSKTQLIGYGALPLVVSFIAARALGMTGGQTAAFVIYSGVIFLMGCLAAETALAGR